MTEEAKQDTIPAPEMAQGEGQGVPEEELREVGNLPPSVVGAGGNPAPVVAPGGAAVDAPAPESVDRSGQADGVERQSRAASGSGPPQGAPRGAPEAPVYAPPVGASVSGQPQTELGASGDPVQGSAAAAYKAAAVQAQRS